VGQLDDKVVLLSGGASGIGRATALRLAAEVACVAALGALLLARHAIPKMMERGDGAIVNISSGTSTIGESTRVAYGVSKAAIDQLTRHLATRYGRDGIRANAIAPGFVLTETAEANVPADVQARLSAGNPTRRLGRPDDIARVVVFLLSEASSYVNGQLIHVDGGHQIAGML
jgi:NAD(P)-dependent dehydrogenase (short-subunit alcohol dehydrogenase family)